MTISEEKESPQKRQESQKIQLRSVNKNYRKRLEMKEKEKEKIEKDLARKEKALAETAALVVLRKKANAIRGMDEEEE